MVPDPGKIKEPGEILLIEKPPYWTSFDLVNKVRVIIKNSLGLKDIKVGHAGTLDPLAEGLMIICTGKATKRIHEFRDLDKEYFATIRLGQTTESHDLETEISGIYPTEHITIDQVKQVLDDFIGEQKQVPPIHSAKMIKGKRAYELARRGQIKQLPPVTVYIRQIELLSFNLPDIKVRLVCSKGTYVRSFARDLGVALQTGGCLIYLKRTAIGTFRLENASTIEKFENYFTELKQNIK
jgi:tRNA pseudouridine55 synthase